MKVRTLSFCCTSFEMCGGTLSLHLGSDQISRSVVSDSLRPRESQHARPPCPSPTPGVHWGAIESVMPSSHLILCHPLLLLPPILPSIRVFSNESTLRVRWPKYWSFSFSIIPSKEIPGLISFRMDWLDLLAVQGTLKNLLQHHSSKASILRLSAFFPVQLSHPYMTTGKTIALARRTFVGKACNFLFSVIYFSGFGHRVMLASEWVQKCSFLCSFCGMVSEGSILTLLWMSSRIHLWCHLVLDFCLLGVLSHWLNFSTGNWSVGVFYFFLV